MSLLRQTLARFGVGGAKVDAVLDSDNLAPGEPVDVSIEVTGGSVEQQVDNIHIALCCQYMAHVRVRDSGEQGDKYRWEKQTYKLTSWTLQEAFSIKPSEQRRFSVVLVLPFNTPVTVGKAKVWLDTQLDVSLAVDPSDRDVLTVKPDPLLEQVFVAVENMGLRLQRAKCEEVKGFGLPFAQEFEFEPVSGRYVGKWKELELVAWREDDGLKLWFEIDRKLNGVGGMLMGMLGAGELKRELYIASGTPDEAIRNQVQVFLDQSTDA